MNREEWLTQVVDRLRPDFERIGSPLPDRDRIRISCGWPSRSAVSSKRRTIGEAWTPKASKDGTHETFISPCLSDPIEVGAVVVHELCHHAVGTDAGHRGPFRRIALAMGLEGKMTATTAGDALKSRLNELVESIGPYPHATLDMSRRKKQTTRMIKVQCKDCGCVIRMTNQWIENVGVPTCGCGGWMEVER